MSIKGKTPAKPFEVVISTEGEQDDVIQWGSDFSSLLPDYAEAIKRAKAASRKDNLRRWVSIRQVLLTESF